MMLRRVLSFCALLFISSVALADGMVGSCGNANDACRLGVLHEASPAERVDTSAVKFSVAGFRMLPNDVSAFISPVRDLNGEACALLKVVAPADFAFSSPLGIVKRKNDTGEIWLYLPKGTKYLTIKHPQWGVMRNFRFRKPLESHVVYEMNIKIPEALPVRPDTVILTKTVTDTVIVDKVKPKTPLTMHAMLTVSVHSNGPSWGVMLALLRKHGFFIHAQGDLRSIGKTVQSCDGDGYLPDSEIKPYYTGETRHSNYAVTAGLVHRLCRWLGVYYGTGYGRAATAWCLAESEGGGYVLNRALTHKGVAAEAGLLLSFGRFSVSTSALTVKGKQWQAAIGVGVRLWKEKK